MESFCLFFLGEAHMVWFFRLEAWVARRLPYFWNFRKLALSMACLAAIDMALLLAGLVAPLTGEPSDSMWFVSLTVVSGATMLVIWLARSACNFSSIWTVGGMTTFGALYALSVVFYTILPLFFAAPYLWRLAVYQGLPVLGGPLLGILKVYLSFTLAAGTMMFMALLSNFFLGKKKHLAPPRWDITDKIYWHRMWIAPYWLKSLDRFLVSRYPVLWATKVHLSAPLLTAGLSVLFYGFLVSFRLSWESSTFEDIVASAVSAIVALVIILWIGMKKVTKFTVVSRYDVVTLSGVVILEFMVSIDFLIVASWALGSRSSILDILHEDLLAGLIGFGAVGICLAAGFFSLVPYMRGISRATNIRKASGVVQLLGDLQVSLVLSAVLAFFAAVFLVTTVRFPESVDFLVVWALLLLMIFPWVVGLACGSLEKFFYVPRRS